MSVRQVVYIFLYIFFFFFLADAPFSYSRAPLSAFFYIQESGFQWLGGRFEILQWKGEGGRGCCVCVLPYSVESVVSSGVVGGGERNERGA